MRPRTMGALAAFVAALFGSVVLLMATGSTEVITQGGTRIGSRVWHGNTIPIVWSYHNPTTVQGCYSSPNAPPATLQSEILAAFQTWENDLDSRVAFAFGGETTVRDVGADGVNVVTFCDSSVLASNLGFGAQVVITSLTVQTFVSAGGPCPPGKGQLPTGFCFPVGTYPAGTIIDADIRFNTFGTVEETLATNGAVGGLEPITQLYDVRNLATHEVGHFVGLSHDPIPQATMNWFVDPNPPSDGVGERALQRADLGTIGRYYPEPSYGSTFGSITGFVSLNDAAADGVHVVAIDPITMLGVAGRFSLSRFEDLLALGPEGPDATTQGTGFYRIDGLPPGAYYVYAEYFDNSDLLPGILSGRLANRYNFTVGNSNVTPGNGLPGAIGFVPALTEFYDAFESPNGGDGVAPGTAADNSDAATLVTVAAGAVTPNINIAINIEPSNGQTPAQRQNPTTRSTIVNDNMQAADYLWNFFLDGGGDDYYAIRFPAALLPPPPYNVAEGLWIHAGRSLEPMVTKLAFAAPGAPAIPDLDRPVVASAGRVLAGGKDGGLEGNFLTSIRDQWNVTVTEPLDLFVIVHQPDPPPGAATFPEAQFALVTCSDATCTSPARVARTLVTQNGGGDWFTVANADVFYDLIVEQHPPVMITGAVPAQMNAGQTGDVVINGFGFQAGVAVDFGPGITVNSVQHLGAQHLRANVSIPLAGATAPRPVDVTVVNPGVVFPNVARIFTVLPLLDDDGDGTPNTTDCAPLDAALESPATEVQNVSVDAAGGSVEIAWDSQNDTAGSATTYDVITGDVGELRTSGGYAAANCAANDHASAPFVDATAVAPGHARYWLVKACNACNAGACTFGDSSLVPDPRDALDASPPCP